MYFDYLPTPLGEVAVASDGAFLTGLWFVGQLYYGEPEKDAERSDTLPVFAETRKWLEFYFSGKRPNFTPALSTEGYSPFRRRVWEELLAIPYGHTISYGEIAARLARESGKNVSAQAVGGAVGHNPISLLIPCHRVMGAGGSYTGYAGGIDRKIALLRLEGVDTRGFFVPKK